MSDAETAAWRFVHLAENHGHVRENAGRFHVPIELFAFPTTFADPAKETHALVRADHVVNHLGEEDGLSDAGAPEEPGFAAALQRDEEIDDFDASEEELGLCGAIVERRRRLMHRPPFNVRHVTQPIDGVAKDIEHAREHTSPDRRHQGPPRVEDGHAAGQALGRGQGNGPHVMRIELNKHLEDDLMIMPRAEQGVDQGKMVREAHIHHTSANGLHRARLASGGRVRCRFLAVFHDGLVTGQAAGCAARLKGLPAGFCPEKRQIRRASLKLFLNGPQPPSGGAGQLLMDC